MTKPRTKPGRVLTPCIAFFAAYALGALTQAWFGAPEVIVVIVMAATAYLILGWSVRHHLRDVLRSMFTPHHHRQHVSTRR